MRCYPAALILTLAAPAALGGPFDGTWDVDAAACAAAYSESRITISGSDIAFVESRCALANPTGLGDMPEARLFDLQCSGEGMTWSERMFLGTSGADGLVVYSRGHASLRERCD